MNHRMLRVIASLCLVLHALAGVWALDRTLCVARDGHVTVELTHAGACDAEARRHNESGSDVRRACSDHSCTDVALSEPTTRPNSDSHLQVATAWRVSDASQNLFAPSFGKSRLGEIPGAVLQVQRARERVVLLI